MSWLDLANHFLSNQRLHAWSWINRTFLGIVFLVGNLVECFGLSLFCFCLVWGEKVASAQDFGRQPKGEDHFKLWFPFFPYLVVAILYCLDICLVRRPFFIILSFSSDLWSGIFFFPWFSFDLRPGTFFFSFSFIFFRSLTGNCFFFFFFCFWSVLAAQQWVTLLSWETPLFLLPRARMEILIPGQGLWWVGILAQGL